MIRLKNVSYLYDAAREPALRDVDLTIPRGGFTSIVGPNGGGKSTLIRLILGLIEPTTGEVRLFGDAPKKTRLRVGYAPQYVRVDARFPISVLDVVLAGRFGANAKSAKSSVSAASAKSAVETRRASRSFADFFQTLFFRFTKTDREIALASLEKMGVADLRARSFGELSGGQRQRVLLARALCSEPELLVLDEPTNNVDPSSAERFYDLLAELNRDASILMASHDLGVVSKRVDSVVCVNRTVHLHPTSEFSGELVRELYRSDVRFVRHDRHNCGEKCDRARENRE